MQAENTPLYELHLKHQAKMTTFAGFNMPLQYSSIKEEVLSVRKKAGLFDVSHMGEILIQGEDTLDFVNHIFTNDVKKVKNEKAIYSPLCRHNGTVVDDLIAYRITDYKILLCVNAANTQKDFEHIISLQKKYQITISDRSKKFSLLALQGPMSETILKSMGMIHCNDGFSSFSVREKRHDESDIILARTGYTGEDGFEIFCDNQSVKNLWKKIIEKGAFPCGLAARDVLRLEAGYPLYGNELNDHLTPLDSALKWTVKMDKGDFVGREALLNYKNKYCLAKLSIDKGVPRTGHIVENDKGEQVGHITSGTMSPTINKGVALAHIEKDKFGNQNDYFIVIRSKKIKAKIHKKAFIKGDH